MIRNMILQIPCHRKSDRSFLKLQKYIPLCARCTGMLIGILMFPIYFYITLSFLFAIILSFSAQIPLLIDGFTQKWKWRSSTNLLRVTTGVLSGNGMGLFISSSVIWILS
ncbi:DUF2085 domain-containing protein [Bacillus paranthracis]|uniref:DUF2085 domain-containing protein n=2 Tax=Bacillus cereus group TaxID=86661 RepID=A0A5M9H2S9_9BACI|nr:MULTISPECIES: DUF2085 domain-containing protein [Bacillus]ACJ79673.1 conserved hypothetical protein [Bacillus cereus AH187]EDZ57898.1 conserved hypothetical protein [Bacillus cereus H3081.97]EJQ01046.1 hypothetical protein IAU_00089 [Bacillus cereus IS075]EJR15455.1 hypothetical protein II7_02087 [Bacillus cereus MSX-A12]EOO86862.1 hypothetical protein IGS_04172 [Bacillus cereus IS845/00]EOO95576.1 hypothetical protein IGQ_03929 [Bacillus cereus IS195]KFK74217.1 hypothetical protein DJ87_